MSKVLGVDLGNKWVGLALTDALKITCKPYMTIEIESLYEQLHAILSIEKIDTVVIGLPKTLKGEHSEQTLLVLEQHKELQEHFSKIHPKIRWILWDERFSSQRASTYQQNVQNKKHLTKEVKNQEHALAAAFILQNYLASLS